MIGVFDDVDPWVSGLPLSSMEWDYIMVLREGPTYLSELWTTCPQSELDPKPGRERKCFKTMNLSTIR